MRVGIDLGTTYSLISTMDAEGGVALMPDYTYEDVFHTPSVVHLTEDRAFVGQMVEALIEQEPDLNVIRFFKREMGNDRPLHYENGTPWYPEAIAALVLKKLRFDAESYRSSEVSGAVITVPAHFSDPQRKAVINAAALADVPILGLIEEPVAAAMHYGVSRKSDDEVLMVYDFGGGTFDATILSMNEEGVYVLAKDGLTELGGKELDEQVGSLVLDQFEQAMGHPPNLNARSLLQLRRASEQLKIELCMPDSKRVERMVVLGDQAVEVELHRSDFEKGVQELIGETREVMMRCLKSSGLQTDDIHAVLLVGGSSMVPLVRSSLRSVFGSVPGGMHFNEPMKAVAFGAAVHACQLSGEAEAHDLPAAFRGVTGHNVGVRTVNPRTGRVAHDTLIKKNMPLPARVDKTYYTTRPNQQRMVLDLVQFRDTEDEVVSLGQMVVGPLPSPRENYPIEVSIEVEEDGTVAVQAYDPQTGVDLNSVFGNEERDGEAALARQRALVRSTFINNL